jgi:hypothetical protein
MFEVKKDDVIGREKVDFPVVVSHRRRTLVIDNDKFFLIKGEGRAKCDKGDKFDKAFGIELAQIRANINMLKDYEKILIGLTKQPEWRKEKKLKPRKTYEDYVKEVEDVKKATKDFYMGKHFGKKYSQYNPHNFIRGGRCVKCTNCGETFLIYMGDSGCKGGII